MACMYVLHVLHENTSRVYTLEYMHVVIAHGWHTISQCRRGLYTATRYRCIAGTKKILLTNSNKEAKKIYSPEDKVASKEEYGDQEITEQEANVYNIEEVEETGDEQGPDYDEESSYELIPIQDEEYSDQEY